MAELVAREANSSTASCDMGEETEGSGHFVDARVLAIFEGAEDVLSLRVVGRSRLEG